MDFAEGDKVEITKKDGTLLKGIILPTGMLSSRDVVILKLDNGYNVGIKKGASGFDIGGLLEDIKLRVGQDVVLRLIYGLKHMFGDLPD